MKEKIRILKTVWQQEGFLRFFWRTCVRFLEYAYYKLFKQGTFVVGEKEYPYFFHLYNATFKKERAVEIPLVMRFVNACKGKEILEVGNVLRYYVSFPHDVVDKYEQGSEVINEDICDYNPGKKYDLIVSISTLEHVGWDETPKEKDKVLRALAHMEELLKVGGTMVVTVPVGYNEDIDGMIRSNRFPFTRQHFLMRISMDNKWREVSYEEVKDSKCDMTYLRANGLFVGILEKTPAEVPA